MVEQSSVEATVFKGSKDGSLKESKIRLGPLKGDQVIVKITHSGLCGTDVHYCSVDQGLGHEGAGLVEEVGPDAHTLKKGDRVGFGYLHSSCGHCRQCFVGFETFCPSRVMYGEGDFHLGSLASHTVIREAFLFQTPASIPSEYAAPLQCGGATVFNALETYGTRPTDRVGVIGVGGLGHLAIQFASKMGCEVVVFSGTDSKKKEAMELGAAEFHATKGLSDLTQIVSKPIDCLLVTTSQQPHWGMYQSILAPSATIFPLSVSGGNLVMPYMNMIMRGLRVQGSLVAARAVHLKMLDFAARHGIRPIIETFPLDREGIEGAFARLEGGKMRYRGVLVAKE
ncbi:hypothetical protein ACLMJK_000611 [Lecanora helva]